MTTTQTTVIHPVTEREIAAAIGRFLDAGIERFGEAGFIAAIETYMAEQRSGR